MEILSEAKNPKKYRESEQHSCLDDEEKLAHAKKVSRDEDEAKNEYKRFYASRIIKRNPNEQN